MTDNFPDRRPGSNSSVGHLGTMMNRATETDKKNFHFLVIFCKVSADRCQRAQKMNWKAKFFIKWIGL
jgi:hypothetical protein